MHNEQRRPGLGGAAVSSLAGDELQHSNRNSNCNARDHGQAGDFAEAWLVRHGVRRNLAGVVAELFGLGGRAA